MNEITLGVSWWGVIVGTIASFALGGLWYSPKLFGTKWLQGVGVTFNEGDKMPMTPMIMQLIGTFLFAWVAGVMAASFALLTFLLITLTIMFIVIANGHFAQKSKYAIMTEAGFIAAMAIIMTITQAIF